MGKQSARSKAGGNGAASTEDTSGLEQLQAMENEYLNPDATSLDPTLHAIINESARRAAIIVSLRQRLQVETQARMEAEKRAEIAEAALNAVSRSKNG